MDVLHPHIVVVDGRRYRVQSDVGGTAVGTRNVRRDESHGEVAQASSVSTSHLPAANIDHPVPKPNGASRDTPNEPHGADGFTRTEGGEWSVRVSVDADLAKRALAGEARGALLRDTGGRVVLPGEARTECRDPVANRGELNVVAGSVEGASAARAVVLSLIHDALASPTTSYTHFVGIPFNQDHVVDAARAFRQAYLISSSDGNGKQFHWNEPGRLRLALCDLKLCSDESRAAAKAALMRARYEVTEMARQQHDENDTTELILKATVAGVSVDGKKMVINVFDSDDHEKKNRLRLLSVCEAFRKEFRDAGLLLPGDDRPFVLRVELATEKEGNKEGSSRSGAASFSSDTTFGELEIAEIHLARADEFDVASGGYFRSVEKAVLVGR
jgi:hypothetical protein|tara:strand:- start:3503 stop:4663 length:1161 start_codon:yes stop_codon:yes gene_type:complete